MDLMFGIQFTGNFHELMPFCFELSYDGGTDMEKFSLIIYNFCYLHKMYRHTVYIYLYMVYTLYFRNLWNSLPFNVI